MQEFTSELALTHILSRLMANKGLKERDVVNATGLPQTTIGNILRGKSKNPRPATLKALAELFDVTVGQLLGHELLETDMPPASVRRPLGSVKVIAPSLAPVTIPLLQWHEVKPWLLGKRAIKTYTTWLANDICKNPKAFALKAKPSMRSHFFFPDVTLLIDPEAPVVDGGTALVFLDASEEPSLRLLSIDGVEKWLQPLEKDRPSVALSPKHSIIGPVAEIRHNPGINIK